MRRFLPHLAVIALLGLLAGCNQSQPPAQAAEGAADATADATAEAPAAPTGPVYLTPAKLDACEHGAVVVVHWNLHETNPDVSDVEIWTGAPGHQTLFAAGGYAGEASTGQPWAYPGTTFSVRNKADGAEVANVVVGGPACPGS